MHTSAFFKLFPPPRFLTLRHAGLDISDDAVRCLEYGSGQRSIRKWNSRDLPQGLIEGGDVKDEQALAAILKEFDHTNDLSYVKVSIPEEKAYLFETDVPSLDMRTIEQNIEFKLEENVPLSAADAVFYFDLLPASLSGVSPRASVSVVPRSYIEHLISFLRSTGIFPVAFEVVPKAIARVIIPRTSPQTELVVHIMKYKTGLYIVSDGVVSFTSTVAWGSVLSGSAVDLLAVEITRVYSYWLSRGADQPAIERIVLVGEGGLRCEQLISDMIPGVPVPVSLAEVWQNIFSLKNYLPPIPHDESLDYAVVAGLALDS